MSLAEILDEIPRLTSAERERVAQKLIELEGDWIDGDDELGPEEKHLLDSRLADYEHNPDLGIPWEEVKARLRQSSIYERARNSHFRTQDHGRVELFAL
jgi:putative addiction module component (TIGR02574 family)